MNELGKNRFGRKGFRRNKFAGNRFKGDRLFPALLLLLFCAVFTAPPVRAQEKGHPDAGQAAAEVRHYHIGVPQKEGGCYTKAVPHKHTGNAGEQGGCYRMPVFHIHTGDKNRGGGCYGKKIFHVHAGSAETSGGCYRTPVSHSHTGSASSPGGCYTRPVYHAHAGSGTAGGACYEPILHVHTDGCFSDAVCAVTLTGGFTLERTYDEYCFHHGRTQHAQIRGIYQHSECGLGAVEELHDMCWTCQIYNGTHSYRKAVCGKTESTVEGYRLKCGKTTETVEHWDTGCGKTEASVERYDISCGKNAETVEGFERNCEKDESSVDAYARSCGREEGEPESYDTGCGREDAKAYAFLTLHSQDPEEETQQTALLAECMDETGFLKGWDGAYRWTKDGKELSERGKRLEVTENAVYTAAPDFEREDIRKEELCLALEVGNICAGSQEEKPPKVEEPPQADKPEEKPEKGGKEDNDTGGQDMSGDRKEDGEKDGDGGKGGNGDSGGSGHDGKGGSGNKEETTAKPAEKPVVEAAAKPEIKRKVPAQSKKKQKAVMPASGIPDETEEKWSDQISQSNKYGKKTEEVRPEPVAAGPEPVRTAVKRVRAGGILESAVKAVTFTVGMAAALAGLLWLLYLSYCHVRIYHRDGEEKCRYAGSCMIKRQEEHYELVLPGRIAEQSETGLFCLRPGRIFNRVNKGKELLILAGKQKESVWIGEEIPLHVFTCV